MYYSFSKDTILVTKEKLFNFYQGNFVTSMIAFAHPVLYTFLNFRFEFDCFAHVVAFLEYKLCFHIRVSPKYLLKVKP